MLVKETKKACTPSQRSSVMYTGVFLSSFNVCISRHNCTEESEIFSLIKKQTDNTPNPYQVVQHCRYHLVECCTHQNVGCYLIK